MQKSKISMRACLMLTMPFFVCGSGTSTEAFPSRITLKHLFGSGYPTGADEALHGAGMCGPTSFTGNSDPKVGARVGEVDAIQKTAEEIERDFTLTRNGFTVLTQAWNSGVGRRLNPAKRGTTWYPDRNMAKRKRQCRQDVWTNLKPQLLNAAPKCWQKRGYSGNCDTPSHQSQDTCAADVGCQWNPATDVKLIDEVIPSTSQRDKAFTMLGGEVRCESGGIKWQQ